MKKLISVILSAVMLLTMTMGMSLTANADDYGSFASGNYATLKNYISNSSNKTITYSQGGANYSATYKPATIFNKVETISFSATMPNNVVKFDYDGKSSTVSANISKANLTDLRVANVDVYSFSSSSPAKILGGGESAIEVEYNRALVNAIAGLDLLLQNNLGNDFAMSSIGFKSSCNHNYSYYVARKAAPGVSGSQNAVCGRCTDSVYGISISQIANISLSQDSYSYDGKVKTPSVYVSDSNGNTIDSSNYYVSYSEGRKKVGKYNVTVNFNSGYYEGSATRSFTIGPKGTSIKSLKSLIAGFTVNYNKQKEGTSGYQIRYSLYSDMEGARTKDIKGASAVALTVRHLDENETYYVQVRTYGKKGNQKYYSAWSKTKKVTTGGKVRMVTNKANVGRGQKIKVKVTGGKGKTVWKSSNPKIASVSSSGVITGKKNGTVTITAKRSNTVVKCTVKVVNTASYTFGRAYAREALREYGNEGITKAYLIQATGVGKGMPDLSDWTGINAVNQKGNLYGVYCGKIKDEDIIFTDIPAGKYFYYTYSPTSKEDNNKAAIESKAKKYLSKKNANYMTRTATKYEVNYGMATVKVSNSGEVTVDYDSYN